LSILFVQYLFKQIASHPIKREILGNRGKITHFVYHGGHPANNPSSGGEVKGTSAPAARNRLMDAKPGDSSKHGTEHTLFK
jgi:hypothetical protein